MLISMSPFFHTEYLVQSCLHLLTQLKGTLRKKLIPQEVDSFVNQETHSSLGLSCGL